MGFHSFRWFTGVGTLASVCVGLLVGSGARADDEALCEKLLGQAGMKGDDGSTFSFPPSELAKQCAIPEVQAHAPAYVHCLEGSWTRVEDVKGLLYDCRQIQVLERPKAFVKCMSGLKSAGLGRNQTSPNCTRKEVLANVDTYLNCQMDVTAGTRLEPGTAASHCASADVFNDTKKYVGCVSYITRRKVMNADDAASRCEDPGIRSSFKAYGDCLSDVVNNSPLDREGARETCGSPLMLKGGAYKPYIQCISTLMDRTRTEKGDARIRVDNAKTVCQDPVILELVQQKPAEYVECVKAMVPTKLSQYTAMQACADSRRWNGQVFQCVSMYLGSVKDEWLTIDLCSIPAVMTQLDKYKDCLPIAVKRNQQSGEKKLTAQDLVKICDAALTVDSPSGTGKAGGGGH